ncbi:MAG: hypothetical protein A4S17_14005 [Proteobacteria bacterium HN_bin10]|nr:MAG: hypothetical protein A4S17_14005 [Proteobacteria bacterium HN_bin10]
MSEVIEWAPFKLKAGVSEEALLRASQQLQREFLDRQAGFVSRRLLRSGDGSYVDMVVWASQEEAASAMEVAAQSTTCSAYFALMGANHADPGAGVTHLRQLKLYE